MTHTRRIPMILRLGLCSAALAACGDDGGAITSAGSEASATDTSTGDESNSNSDPTSNSNTNSMSGTTEEPTGGSDSMTGMSTPTTGETETTGPVDPTETDPSTSTSEPPAECGNGNVEGDEQCDDGNQEPGDGCEPECVFTPECGNGEVEQGELCDDGNQVDDDECSNACQINEVAECGDGVTQRGEDCDDGNLEDGDGCQADCTITPPDCGNGVVEPGEDCDDGNNTNGGPGDFCKNDCTVFVPANCSAPAEYVICDDMLNLQNKQDKTQAHKAMGICNDTPANSVQITDWSFMATDNASWQIARGFGTYSFDHDGDPNTPNQLIYSPREGSTFLMISTGAITAPNNQGIVVQPPASQEAVGTNNNPDAPDTMPAPLTEAFGSDDGNGGTPFIGCDGVGDCSDTLFEQWDIGFGDPNDKLWFTFKTTVPPGTFGYTFDFVYCSAEWPQWVGDPYNDLLVAWQTDPTPDDPNADPPVDAYTGNVTFIPNPNDPAEGLPLTVTALDPYLGSTGFSDNEPQLAGTGFEGNACSDWFTAKGGVQPGAEVTIGFFIADMTDTIWTTTALIDNFRWDCEGCVPSEVDDCGVQDPQ